MNVTLKAGGGQRGDHQRHGRQLDQRRRHAVHQVEVDELVARDGLGQTLREVSAASRQVELQRQLQQMAEEALAQTCIQTLLRVAREGGAKVGQQPAGEQGQDVDRSPAHRCQGPRLRVPRVAGHRIDEGLERHRRQAGQHGAHHHQQEGCREPADVRSIRAGPQDAQGPAQTRGRCHACVVGI
jgi:hypothetical protein